MGPNCGKPLALGGASTDLQANTDIDAAVRWAMPRLWGRLAVRAFTRSWGRDVMLYTGGVSFFALLAVFPAIAILIGLVHKSETGKTYLDDFELFEVGDYS